MRPITTGDLPPSSSVTGVRFSAAARITSLPTFGLPVKNRWSNGSPPNAAPTSGPPWNTATSVSSNADATSRSTSAAVCGTNSDILIIARLPAASMPVSGPKVR